MSDTVVLNGDYQPLCIFPLSTIDWQTAIKAVFSEKVVVVKNHDNWMVHSQRLTMPVPSIVAMRDYVDATRGVNFNRRSVYIRDNYTCQYCGNKFHYEDLTFDHVIPRCDGGQTTWENVVTACRTCNFLKGSDLMDPLTKPRKPTYWEMSKKAKDLVIMIKDPAWQDYLNWPEDKLIVRPEARMVA